MQKSTPRTRKLWRHSNRNCTRQFGNKVGQASCLPTPTKSARDDFRTMLALCARWAGWKPALRYKRRHRAIQRVGNRAEQLGLAFHDYAVRADSVHARLDQILFDDRHGLRA